MHTISSTFLVGIPFSVWDRSTDIGDRMDFSSDIGSSSSFHTLALQNACGSIATWERGNMGDEIKPLGWNANDGISSQSNSVTLGVFSKVFMA